MRHDSLAPDDVVGPYDVYLADQSAPAASASASRCYAHPRPIVPFGLSAREETANGDHRLVTRGPITPTPTPTPTLPLRTMGARSGGEGSRY